MRVAQTTVDDIGRAVRSIGVSLEAGLVAFGNASRLSAYPTDLTARHRREVSRMKRMANEGRIRVCASPVVDRRQVRGDAENLSSFATSPKSFQVVAAKPQ